MPDFLIDLGRSLRVLRRQPGLAAAAVVALAMGIGFTTTMFSIVHGGTRALPFAEPHEIVAVQQTTGGPAVRPWTLLQWRASTASFEGLAAWQSTVANVSGGGDPDRLSGAAITPNALALLGAVVAEGRPFDDADAAPGAPRVALISDAVWRTRFDARASAVGDVIRLNGVPHEVIGIMPPGFGFPINARLWTPLSIDAAAGPGEGDAVDVLGRLKDGVTPAQASAEMSAVMARLAAAAPSVFERPGARVLPFAEIETPVEVRRGLQVLVIAVSLAFLVACANVANLLLARAAARGRETALRTALGASRARLITAQLAETTLLAALASSIGLAMAAAGLRVFRVASAEILQAFWVDFRIDAVVVGFASTLGLLAALAAGLLPALRATKAETSPLLKGDASGAPGFRIGRLGRVLVVVQLALACGLFGLTATFVRASASLRSVDLVFPATEILTTTLAVPAAVIDEPAARRTLLTRLRDEIGTRAGGSPTAFTNTLPGRGASRWPVIFADRPAPDRAPFMGVVMVTPEFFTLADATARQGRLLTWQDDERGAPVAVANESFVRRFSPDREVIDRRIRLGEREFTIVGVVPDLRMQDPEDLDGSGIYVSMLQARPFAIRTMTRTTGAPLESVPALRAAVARVDADLPVLEPASLYEAIYSEKRVLDAIAGLFLAFGVGTVFLALIGLFALLSFTVTARRREFGVRMALGASTRDIVRVVLRRAAGEIGWGLTIGLAIAFAISRALAATLENVPPAGAGVFAAIAAVVALGAAMALWTPVRRAVGLSVSAALRE